MGRPSATRISTYFPLLNPAGRAHKLASHKYFAPQTSGITLLNLVLETMWLWRFSLPSSRHGTAAAGALKHLNTVMH